MVNWKAVYGGMRDLPDHNHTQDWSDGSQFPWWVWLANHAGSFRSIVNEGVTRVELEVADGWKSVVVHSARQVSRVYLSETGKMIIHPPPSRYDP